MIKKRIKYFVIASALVLFTSCKKEFICNCRSDVNGADNLGQDFLAKAYKKKNAEAKCKNLEILASTPNTVCNLKNE